MLRRHFYVRQPVNQSVNGSVLFSSLGLFQIYSILLYEYFLLMSICIINLFLNIPMLLFIIFPLSSSFISHPLYLPLPLFLLLHLSILLTYSFTFSSTPIFRSFSFISYSFYFCFSFPLFYTLCYHPLPLFLLHHPSILLIHFFLYLSSLPLLFFFLSSIFLILSTFPLFHLRYFLFFFLLYFFYVIFFVLFFLGVLLL